MQRRPPRKPHSQRKDTIPEVPTVLPKTEPAEPPRPATADTDDKAHEAIRRMIEAAYT